MISIFCSIFSCIMTAVIGYICWKHQKKSEAFYCLEVERLEMIDATTAMAMLLGNKIHDAGLINGELERANGRILEAKKNYNQKKNEVLVY